MLNVALLFREQIAQTNKISLLSDIRFLLVSEDVLHYYLGHTEGRVTRAFCLVLKLLKYYQRYASFAIPATGVP